MTETLFLIDGSSYTWRAFHAYKATVREIDGLPINAVKGFSEMLWRFLKRGIAGYQATHLAVCFDSASSREYRQAMFPAYKAQRPSPPSEITAQFPLVRRAVSAFGLTMIEKPGFEADDLVATYARLAVEEGMRVVAVSGDKDYFQLVTDQAEEPGDVRVFDPFWKPAHDDPDQRKGKLYGVDGVVEKMGVPPDLVPALQGLTGDIVDNVPGVAGIGPKTAVKLLNQYGGIAEIIRDMALVEPKGVREKLFSAGEDVIRLSHKLVKLNDRVEVDTPLDEMTIFDADPERIIAFTRAIGLPWLTKEVGDHFSVDPASVTPDRRTAAPGAGTPWLGQRQEYHSY